MPYSSEAELPDHVKKHGHKKARQWLAVFNSVYEKTGSEEAAFKAANSKL